MTEPGPGVFLEAVYATDEAVYRMFPGDFAPLCPAHQIQAQGSDGSISPADRWRLSSHSVNFERYAVRPGMIVELSLSAPVRQVLWPKSGLLLAVDSLEPSGAVRLRSPGQPAGSGEPPAPAGGIIDCNFLVRTYYPQIEDASFSLNREFAIDPRIPGRAPSDLRDLRDLQRACVLMVMHGLLVSSIQQARDRWDIKARAIERLLDQVLSRLAIRWRAGEERRLFGMRVTR